MTKKIQFMRDKDINIVNENVNQIIKKAHSKEIQIIEPTLDEFIKVRSIILNYIKKEKRIIYGGYAWNYLINNVNPSDAFYDTEDMADVDFYSHKPIEDIKKICDLIYAEKFKFIQGKSAQHDDTYTIFVNFTAYCDITYMPTNIYNNCITQSIDGYRFTHPKLILVDILRQYTDPMTSYWKLEKNTKRGKLIIKNFPLELNTGKYNIIKLEDKTIKLVNYLIAELVKLNTLLFIGEIATNAYIKPNIDIKMQSSTYNNTLIEVISSKISKDVSLIYSLIVKYFLSNKDISSIDNAIIIEQYYPFFQFIDKKVILKYNNEPFLIIYGNNEKCIPFNNINLLYGESSSKIMIGTFNVVFMYYLIKFHLAFINHEKTMIMQNEYMMAQLLEAKNTFFEANNKNILDQTIFEDFKVDCLGYPISPMRKFLLSRRDRRLMSRTSIQPYDPAEEKTNYKTDGYQFNNYSGNIINNPRDYIFNPKKHNK
jgi:hypothetical protein